MKIDSKYFSLSRYVEYFGRQMQAWEARPRGYSERMKALLRCRKGHRRYTIISACYNVEEYIGAFIDSLIDQRLDFRRHLHLICVDDGSTDGTADIIKRYAKQYPDNITYLYKENGGQGSARNFGIPHAQTEWVTFIDPDDIIDFNAFYRIDKAMASHPEAALVSMNVVIFREATGTYHTTHPLAYKYRRVCSCYRAAELGNNVQMHLASALFRKSVIEKHSIRIPEDCRPVFEDSHFVTHYLAHVQDKEVLFLRRAKYYYRKRSANTSTMDGKWTDKRLFRDVVLHGHLDILQRYADMGLQTDYAARVFFYDTIWSLRYLVNHPQRWAFLTAEERAGYLSALRRCFELISPENIDAIDLNANNWYWRLGMLFCFKRVQPSFHTAVVERFSQQERSITLRLFAEPQADIRLYDEEQPIEPLSRKGVRYTLADELFLHETVLILPKLAEGHRLSITCNGLPVCFTYRQDTAGKPVLHTLQLWVPLRDTETLQGINSRRTLHLATGTPDPADLTLTTEVVQRMFPCPPPCTDAAYNHAWVFMDRLHLADDNAEHLYRYTAAQSPEFPIYYVLHRDSADWARLQAEGFRLLPFGSAQHKAALHGCDVIVSSHVNAEQLDPFRDDCLVTKKYAFLQHGVILDSCYNWLNGPKIDLFVTTTPPEWKDLQNDFYKYTDREMKLVGLPRHDALLRLTEKKQKRILIMPTWRSYLMWSSLSAADFAQTPYFRFWNAFLNSDILRRAHEEFGYEVSYFPHPELRGRSAWMAEFRLPPYVTIPAAGTGYGQLFSESGICITDYSSAIFDAAFLQRAIIYYQFDSKEFWSNHLCDPGYFSFEQDGFGPVAETPEAMEAALGDILTNGGTAQEMYRERMERTFPLRDGRNNERCYRAIRELLHLPPQSR